MSKLWLFKGFLSAAAIVAINLCLLSHSTAEARSIEILNVNIRAELLPDGSMKVRENRTFRFVGSFTGIGQKLLYGGPLEYKGIVVSENAQAYRLVKDYPTTIPGTYSFRVHDKNCHYDRPVADQDRAYMLVDWSFLAQDVQRIFTLDYLVENVILVHNDIAELHYVFIGSEWDYPSNQVLITLILPPGAGEEDLLAWGHGPLYGNVKIVSPNQVTWEVSPLPANTALTGRVVLPLSLVPAASVRSKQDGLQAILAEEEVLVRRATYHRKITDNQWLILFVTTTCTSLFLVLARLKTTYKKKVFRGKYYRELPADYPPEVVGYLENRKRIKTSFFTARVLDLARRGYIQIEEVDRGYFMNRKKSSNLRLTELKKTDAENSIDALVMEFFFDCIAAEPSIDGLQSKGNAARSITSEQICAFAKKKPWIFTGYIQKWENAVIALAERERFFSETPVPIGKFIYICVLSLFALYVLAAMGLIFFPIFLLILSLLTYIFYPRIQLTDYGADQNNKWRAFKRFLLHFSSLNTAVTESVKIWEHYLVYAVVLGVSGRVAGHLKMANTKLAEESSAHQVLLPRPGSAVFKTALPDYNIIAQNVNTSLHIASMQSATGIKSSMQQMIRNYVGLQTSSSSYSSGLGGGFSGGGGGGLGGGGGSFR